MDPAPKSDEVWREFMQSEMPDGHTFDPISYLSAAREYGDSPVEGLTWEELYKQDPALCAWDIIGCSNHVNDPVERDHLLKSALRIAETLPDTKAEYNSRGVIVNTVFWKYFDLSQYEKCEDLIADVEKYASDESVYYAKKALVDPEAYKQSLRDSEE